MPPMKRIVAAAAVAAGLGAALAACGGSGCPFGNIRRVSFAGSVTDGFRTHDVAVPSEPSLEVDLASSAPNGQVSRADAWLTTADCAKLFDGPYPTASGAPPAPLCRVFLGPVAAGAVSARQKLDAGQYRVFVQGYSSNQTPASYSVDVGIWGNSCFLTP